MNKEKHKEKEFDKHKAANSILTNIKKNGSLNKNDLEVILKLDK
jgi:hypothetical protein